MNLYANNQACFGHWTTHKHKNYSSEPLDRHLYEIKILGLYRVKGKLFGLLTNVRDVMVKSYHCYFVSERFLALILAKRLAVLADTFSFIMLNSSRQMLEFYLHIVNGHFHIFQLLSKKIIHHFTLNAIHQM
jgi:hypothetical protein